MDYGEYGVLNTALAGVVHHPEKLRRTPSFLVPDILGMTMFVGFRFGGILVIHSCQSKPPHHGCPHFSSHHGYFFAYSIRNKASNCYRQRSRSFSKVHPVKPSESQSSSRRLSQPNGHWCSSLTQRGGACFLFENLERLHYITCLPITVYFPPGIQHQSTQGSYDFL